MSNRPIKVVLFAGKFELRGRSAYTLRLAEGLEEHGVTPKIVCSDASKIPPELRAELPIRIYRHQSIPLWGWLLLEVMVRDLSRDPPDLIHVQSRNMLRGGAWLARRLKRPMVLTIHDYLGRRERLRFRGQHARRIIAVSQSVKSELLQRSGLPASMVRVIHSGVVDPNGEETLPVLDPGHVPVVGTAGPLEATKGHPYFLGAARRVLATRPDVQFLVAGAGPEETNLRRLSRDLDISDHVTFIPNLSDFSTSLAAMDIFCLPSLRQGLGTIMLDAMALARPVIATGVGGVYSAVRDGETGLVVPPSNSVRLAERILELLNDPVRARSIGESGRRFVLNDFSVNSMVAETAKLYREVIEHT